MLVRPEMLLLSFAFQRSGHERHVVEVVRRSVRHDLPSTVEGSHTDACAKGMARATSTCQHIPVLDWGAVLPSQLILREVELHTPHMLTCTMLDNCALPLLLLSARLMP